MTTTNLIQRAREEVAALTQRAYERAAEAGVLPGGQTIHGTIEVPKDSKNGDFASSFAMAGARALHKAPRAIATALLDHMELEGSLFQRVEIAGPGFLNFFYAPRWYGEVLSAVESDPAGYGTCDEGAGRRVMVEFVSANPTGPMHMGNARGGVLGDTLANVLARCGYTAWKEFYVNDAGNQIAKFAQSIYARCMERVLGEESCPLPENCFPGDDIRELAAGFLARCKESASGETERSEAPFPGETGEEEWLEAIKSYARSVRIPESYAGDQPRLARSIYVRCMQRVLGEEKYPFPADGYHGDDIRELANGFLAQCDRPFPGETGEGEWLEAMSAYGLSVNIPRMEADLRKYRIEYDRWFLESELHDSGYVAETVEQLSAKGWTYERDGALWLRTGELLRQKFLAEGKTEAQLEKLELKDDVLRRANGFYTYFAADIAYHRDKFEKRGFDLVINVWGADHHGHVARLQAALDGLGLDGSHRLVIVLMQLVNLFQDNKPVKMSKRTGKAIALHDLLDEISVDAARYYFNNRAPVTPLDFDLDLAVRQDSDNPVYYVQYAHARICSLISNLAADGAAVPKAAEVDPALLDTEEERALVKTIASYPEELRQAARSYDPSRVNRYLTGLAGDFHRFYNACRMKGEEPRLQAARLKLADCTRMTLANGLGLLGVTAPEKM